MIDNPTWLKDGSFLWQSERNGWRHIYHYAQNGTLASAGDRWQMGSADRLTALTRTKASFTSPARRTATSRRRPYRIKLDGTGLTRLTTTDGSHRVSFSPTASLFIDSWSDINTPTQTRLHDADGKLVRVIDENKVAAIEAIQTWYNGTNDGQNTRRF